MPFWKCYYHVIWATKHREPLITSSIEPIIFQAVHAKSAELGCPILAINAVNDHIHVAVAIASGIAAGTWVGTIKGAASHAVNISSSPDMQRFQWQGGYGILTLGEKNLPLVTRYIAHQKEHHAQQTTIPYLERDE